MTQLFLVVSVNVMSRRRVSIGRQLSLTAARAVIEEKDVELEAQAQAPPSAPI